MTVSPSSLTRPAHPVTSLLFVLALVLGLTGGVASTVAVAPPAEAAVSTYTANRALSFAASKKGAPYQWGAVGPNRFDCSGLTKWAYAGAGKWLPRTAAQQRAATIVLRRSQVRKGDLVFFFRGSNTYHMGIYAGNGKIWHSPRAGERVKLSVIWTRSIALRRVR